MTRFFKLKAGISTIIILAGAVLHGQTDTINIITGGIPDNIFSVDTSNVIAVKLAKKNLTYFWTGRGCPSFINTQFKYGFSIKCTGCLVTTKIKWHNKRVVRKIDKAYGKNWFENNKWQFY